MYEGSESDEQPLDYKPGKKRRVQEYGSFLRSRKVGIATLVCINLLKNDKKEVNEAKLSYLIDDIIIKALPLCKGDGSVYSGAAGYLHALLLLER